MKRMRRFAVAFGSAALVSGVMALNTPVSADTVKLSGCLIRGEGDDGYLLINPPMQPGTPTGESRTVTPGAMGTTAAFANVFYWLDKDDDLRAHVGHRVEIEGELKGDIKKGELEIDRKDAWTEIEVKSDGRELKARVPNTSVIAGPREDRELSILVRRVDVDKVRMLDAACR